MALTEAGMRGLWCGAPANVARAALLSAGQLATYDQTKQAMVTAQGLLGGSSQRFSRLYFCETLPSKVPPPKISNNI